MVNGKRLTPRQQEVFDLLKKGWKLEAVGALCNPPIAKNTVKHHVRKIYRKVDEAGRVAIWRARYLPQTKEPR